MLIAQDEEGRVCIDGKPFKDIFKDLNAAASRMSIVARSPGGRPCLCGIGVIAVVAFGGVDAARAAICERGGARDAIARKTGPPAATLRQFEDGWCDFRENASSEAYRLGALAYQQCA